MGTSWIDPHDTPRYGHEEGQDPDITEKSVSLPVNPEPERVANLCCSHATCQQQVAEALAERDAVWQDILRKITMLHMDSMELAKQIAYAKGKADALGIATEAEDVPFPERPDDGPDYERFPAVPPELREAFEDVIKRCDCWSETALRMAPAYAVRPKNHDPSCPIAEEQG